MTLHGNTAPGTDASRSGCGATLALTPRRPAGRVFSLMARASLEQRMGFAAAFLALFVLGLCTVASMNALTAKREAQAVATRLYPAMQDGLALEHLAYESAHHAAIFAFSGNLDHYSGGRIRLASLRVAADRFAERSSPIQNERLRGDTAWLREEIEKLDTLLEEKRAFTDAATLARTELREAANALQRAIAALPPDQRNRQARTEAEPFLIAVERIAASTSLPPSGIAALDEARRAALTDSFLALWQKAEPLYAEAEKRAAPPAGKTETESTIQDHAADFHTALTALHTAEDQGATSGRTLEQCTERLAGCTRTLAETLQQITVATTKNAATAAQRAATTAGVAAAIIILFVAVAVCVCHRHRMCAVKPEPTTAFTAAMAARDREALLRHNASGESAHTPNGATS